MGHSQHYEHKSLHSQWFNALNGLTWIVVKQANTYVSTSIKQSSVMLVSKLSILTNNIKYSIQTTMNTNVN